MNSHKTFDYSKYMTIEVLEDGYEVYFGRDVEYNLNGHKWVSLKANLISPTLKKGDLLSLRCSLMPGEGFGGFMSNGKAINLRGNILSLIFKDDINLDISGYRYVFYGTFKYYYGNNIVCVEKNFLPATTLASNCYNSMFEGCTGLTTAPALPATTLTDSCYNSMFEGCTGLTTAPALPATTLASNCYNSMFYGCTSLTTAPELPATTLADGSYYFMFNGCTKLNYIKMFATDKSATNCLYYWVSNVASTGTFVKNPAMTTLYYGSSGIPKGWTVVNDGPVTFSIQNADGLVTEYTIPHQMTWEEFINSEYNINNYFQIMFDYVYYRGGTIVINSYNVLSTDLIIENGAYTTGSGSND